MDSSRRVTSLFIAVALLALAGLAMNVSRQKPVVAEPDMSVLPGLAENLRSIEDITGYPHENFRGVKIMRAHGDEISVVRQNMEAGFEYRGAQPADADKAACSTILYTYSVFLDELSSGDSLVITGGKPEEQIARLVYTGFDGLILENTVFRVGDATWLKMTADYSEKLAAESPEKGRDNLLSASEVKDIITRLQGGIYKMPDRPPQ